MGVRELFDMTGRAALVSGAGRGIGAASALALAEAGADVAVIARSLDQVEEVAEAARGLGRRAVAIVADVTDREAAVAAVERAATELGRLDAVVNVVGGHGPRSFMETSADDLRRAFDLNVVSGLGLVQAAVPHATGLIPSSGLGPWLR